MKSNTEYYLIPLLLISILLPSLIDLGYWLSDIETVLILLESALVGFLLGFVLRSWPKSTAVIIGIMVCWLVDAYFLTSTLLPVIFGTAVAAIALSKYRSNLFAMLMVFCVFWNLSNVFLPAKNILNPLLKQVNIHYSKAHHASPPIVHIILDEQMSPDAVPASTVGNQTAQNISSDYVKRGFKFYSNVHSLYHKTQFSITDLMAMDAKHAPNFSQGEGGFTYKINHNNYYKRLAEKNYTILTVQSNFLRICTPEQSVNCFTYNRAAHGHAMTRYASALGTRLKLAMLELHYRFSADAHVVSSVSFYRKIAQKLHKKLDIKPNKKPQFFTRPVASLWILDDIKTLLNSPKRGTAYVFHIMLPHFPYILDKQCQIKPYQGWTAPNRHNFVAIPQKEIYAGYWDQASCAHMRVMEIIDYVLASPQGADAVIMIHGDHGARISGKAKHADNFTNEADRLQTYLAVKAPSAQSGKDETRFVLQDLVSEIMASFLHTAPETTSINAN